MEPQSTGEPKVFDVIIAGAGPAGCTCAYLLAGKGLKIAVVEKGIFPRDKICGDALSADVINQFHRIDKGLAQRFGSFMEKKATNGVRFFAPNHKHLDIDFINPVPGGSAGFICRRMDFDNFYFNQIKNLEGVQVFLDQEIISAENSDELISIKTKRTTFNAKVAIGADGAHSVLNRLLTLNKIEKEHFSAGLRQYYENVTGFHEGNHIELHFYDGILPGYFWIFSLPENRANVGLAMLSSVVSRDKINLKEKLNDIIKNHPNIKERFMNAKPVEEIKGYGLPMGSKKRTLSGNRFLLLGDAAGLIDPFTGEGIGNAIRSGRLAADHVLKMFKDNRFDAKYNSQYDKLIYQKMWNELRISHSLQKLLKYPRIFNFVVNKANKNKSVRTLLTSMLDNVDLKKELLKPSFYFRLFFN